MKEIKGLDLLDRKILYELDLNARRSNLQIAKKVRASREVVDYRIKRMIKNGIITRFYSHIQAQKFGYTIYKVYLKTKGLGIDEEKELIDYFVKNKNVYRVAECDGIYDIIVSFTAKDVYKLDKILKDCFRKYHINFLSKDITISTKIYHSRREYLIGKKQKEVPALTRCGENGDLVLDEKNLEIVKLLANNARLPVLDIAQRIGLTSAAVIYRMKELVKKDIISAYRCSLNLEKIGYLRCKITLGLHFTHPKKEKELHQYCLQHPNVNFFLYCIGHWDFEVEFEVPDMAEFHIIYKEMKTRFTEIIKGMEYVIISKEHKFDYFPGCYPPFPLE